MFVYVYKLIAENKNFIELTRPQLLGKMWNRHELWVNPYYKITIDF